MEELARDGRYTLPADLRDKLAADFDAGCCDDAQTAETIRRIFETQGYLLDTHTAVAVKVYADYRARTGDSAPVIIASTASPFKFCGPVAAALGKTVDTTSVSQLDALASLTGQPIPAPLAALAGKTPRFDRVVRKDDILSTLDLLL